MGRRTFVRVRVHVSTSLSCTPGCLRRGGWRGEVGTISLGSQSPHSSVAVVREWVSCGCVRRGGWRPEEWRSRLLCLVPARCRLCDLCAWGQYVTRACVVHSPFGALLPPRSSNYPIQHVTPLVSSKKSSCGLRPASIGYIVCVFHDLTLWFCKAGGASALPLGMRRVPQKGAGTRGSEINDMHLPGTPHFWAPKAVLSALFFLSALFERRRVPSWATVGDVRPLRVGAL